jgi:cyclopropane fatty-acyl-phospholipid synthase-like methyltransferase
MPVAPTGIGAAADAPRGIMRVARLASGACEHGRLTHVTDDTRLLSARFPRASRYHPEWVLASASGGANCLWLAEWLSEALTLTPGMRVLDLACGRAASSIFLHREFGVQVSAADLWFSAAENAQRIADAGAAGGVTALQADARALAFDTASFDAVVCIDGYPYFGTDDLYLNSLARVVKPGGVIAIAGAGLMQEIEGAVPEHLQAWWTRDLWCLHSAPWWQRHWSRTGLVDVDVADTMLDGWRRWLDWHHVIAPDNAVEIAAVEADAGRYLGYVRVVARRTPVEADEVVTSLPAYYVKRPLLREA